MAFRIPEQTADGGHYQHLIEVKPALDEHRAERSHDMFVIESADHSHQYRPGKAPYPFVAFEVYVFLFPGEAHQEDGYDCEQNARPLICIEFLTEDQHRSDQHQHRSGRIDRTHDGEREMLESEVPADP